MTIKCKIIQHAKNYSLVKALGFNVRHEILVYNSSKHPEKGQTRLHVLSSFFKSLHCKHTKYGKRCSLKDGGCHRHNILDL